MNAAEAPQQRGTTMQLPVPIPTQEAAMKAGDCTKGQMFMIVGWSGHPFTPVDPSEGSEGASCGDAPKTIIVCSADGKMQGMGILAIRDGRQVYALPVTVGVELVE